MAISNDGREISADPPQLTSSNANESDSVIETLTHALHCLAGLSGEAARASCGRAPDVWNGIMYRVASLVVVLSAVFALGACSSRSNASLLSFSGDNTIWNSGFWSSEKSDPKPRRASAASTDVAPAGSWRTASKNALADRDYSSTRLSASKAQALINRYRKENGLGPVTLHPLLARAAKSHSSDLAKWDRISHYGSDGSNPWQRVQKVGYKARLAAENVGTGQASIEEVFRGWQESESHNRNLLMEGAEHMGIALVVAPETKFRTFWTLVLAAET